MATSATAGDRLPVNCGVRLEGSSFVLAYKMGKNVDKKDIFWDWENQGEEYTAKLEAKTKTGDIKYHTSAPISFEAFKGLGPDGS